MEFLQGTLEMLILRTLVFGKRHGYAIAQSIRQTSDEALFVEAGSLYPALQRLELQKLITAKWDISETGRRARFYSLTPAGKRKLTATVSRWDDFVSAVRKVLQASKQER
jgi:transcriptional regulator